MSDIVYDKQYVNKVFRDIKEIDNAEHQATLVLAYLEQRSSEIKDPFREKIKESMQMLYSNNIHYIEFFSKDSFNFKLKDEESIYTCQFISPCTYADLFNGEVVFNNDPVNSYCVLMSQKTIGQQTLEEV